MSRLVKENTDMLVKIPMKGKITSLIDVTFFSKGLFLSSSAKIFSISFSVILPSQESA